LDRWIIPEDAEKPKDIRIKSGKYIKKTEKGLGHGAAVSSQHATAAVAGFDERAKITQAKLAEEIGVTESTLSCFVNDTKDTFSLEQMIGIARILNVSTDSLLCITDVPDRKNYGYFRAGFIRRGGTESLYWQSQSAGGKPPAGKPPLRPAYEHDCPIFR